MGFQAPVQSHIDGFEAMAVGAYLGSEWGRTDVSGAINADTIYGTLVRVPTFRTFDKIVLEVVIPAAGKSAYLGVFNVHPITLEPSTLVVDAGTVSINAAGIVDADIDLRIRGLHYIIVLPEANFTTQLIRYIMSPLGYKTSDLNDAFNGYSKALAYGALPANFPSDPTPNMVSPNLVLRIKSMG